MEVQVIAGSPDGVGHGASILRELAGTQDSNILQGQSANTPNNSGGHVDNQCLVTTAVQSPHCTATPPTRILQPDIIVIVQTHG